MRIILDRTGTYSQHGQTTPGTTPQTAVNTAGSGRLTRLVWRYELPTVALAAAIYGAWFLLVAFHAYIPWWLLIPLAGYVVGWHHSLRHETVHGLRRWPVWLKYLLVAPPLTVWNPYPAFRRSHSRHHVNANLTTPGTDPESYYHTKAQWRAMGPVWRAIWIVNQTVLGRLLIGPALYLWKMIKREPMRILRGDMTNALAWAVHVPLVVAMLWGLQSVFGLVWWQYLLVFAYPGQSVALWRAFYEHRWGDDAKERTVIVEASLPMGLLYLFNTLHAAHHQHPTLPWYELPRYYRDNREAILADNGNYLFADGYWGMVRRWLVKPVFIPVHPTL